MLDELADGDEGGGEVEAEDDDGGVAAGHPPEFAVAVHPGVGAFDGPALGGLDGGGDAGAGDLGGGSDEFLGAGSSYRLNVRGGRYRRNRDGRAFFRSQVRERWR